jgi:hypothetical protein
MIPGRRYARNCFEHAAVAKDAEGGAHEAALWVAISADSWEPNAAMCISCRWACVGESSLATADQ